MVKKELPRITSFWDGVAHASYYYKKLGDSATNIKKMYRKGALSESELIEA